MKTFVAALLLAGLVATQAACPNQCNGHGSCTTDEQCRCWKGFEGYDCSQRACPQVEAWAVDHLEGAHRYAECAGKGICDRSTGSCACFDGYTGRGCERSTCPNACSGHGQCRLIADLANYNAGGFVGTTYSWDEKAITACVCDGGFMGADCSQRICPHGDDPMTVCEQGDTEQVQQVEFNLYGEASADFSVPNSDFYLRFKTYANDVFHTSKMAGLFGYGGANAVASQDTNSGSEANLVLDVNDATTGLAKVMGDAIEALPNFAATEVTVSKTSATEMTALTAGGAGAAPQWQSRMLVTFHHENSGNSYGAQNLLQCPQSRTYTQAAIKEGDQSGTFTALTAGSTNPFSGANAYVVLPNNNFIPASLSGKELSVQIDGVSGASVTLQSAGTAALGVATLIAGSSGVTVQAATSAAATLSWKDGSAEWYEIDTSSLVADSRVVYKAGAAKEYVFGSFSQGTTFGCAAAGCQPLVKQPRSEAGYVAAAGLGTGGAFSASSSVGFTDESVLTCPLGQICNAGSVSQGSVNFQFSGASLATANVYARGFGSVVPASAAGTTADGFTFLGNMADIATGGSGVSDPFVFSVSAIMPDTWAYVASAATSDLEYQVRFNTASCAVTTDVTVGGAAPFENVDVENIECAGRGECDRDTGLCSCFEGYTGNACGEQTILV